MQNYLLTSQNILHRELFQKTLPLLQFTNFNYVTIKKYAEYFANKKTHVSKQWLKYMCFLFGTLIAL